ncbi:MAG: hypothetical protein ABSA47_16315, partial [Verrucomicrobiota bacterium]
SQAETSTHALQEIPVWQCLTLLALFTLAMFAKVLFISPHEVLSNINWDLNYYFIPRRSFGFNELRSGNLALWNPHCAAGTPFFGNFEPALLYPLNFLYLLLPLVPAINWTIALHLFLGGVFTFHWVRSRGLHSLACLLSALIFVCCGPHFLQIQVGHLSNLATLIWAPLLFLVIDKLVDRPSLALCLLGMFVVAMMILAGHPQYVFYLGVAAGIYSILNLIRARNRGTILLGLAAIALGGACLAAVQLFTGLQEGRESVRSLGTSYDFASTFSFPPENFLTLVAPWCFGDMLRTPYWGRWYLTEVSLFVSVMGLLLAVLGMARGRPATRRFSITMLLIVLLLAMGCYTPLFPLLYHYVPGFNMFRGMDKFLWLAALFLALLAGIGMDLMLRRQSAPWWLVIGAAGLGIVLCLLATLPTQRDWWAGVIQSVPNSNSTLRSSSDYWDPLFISVTSTQASLSLIRGGLTLFAAAFLLRLAHFRRNLACAAILLLAFFELTSFAASSLASFTPRPFYSPGVRGFLAQHPGDFRIQHSNPNAAMTAGALDIGGDDPTGLLRYRRFLNFSEGLDPDKAPVGAAPKFFDGKALRMVRFRYGFPEGERNWVQFDDGLPHLLLVDHFRLITNYHQIFATLTNSDFKMDQEVILESQPTPLPRPAPQKGTVKLLASSTDWLEIEANVPAPCLLLITDSYSSGWRARALPGGVPAQYQIMPANYCLRAIPLPAGLNRLRVEYSPSGFRVGRVVSLLSLALFLSLSGLALKNHFRELPADLV